MSQLKTQKQRLTWLLDSYPQVICSPAGDCALDLGGSLQLAVQHAAREIRNLLVGCEAECDQMSSPQLGNAWTQVSGQQSLEPCPLFETDDAVLRSERHVARRHYRGQQGDCNYDVPAAGESGIACEVDRNDDDVDDENRNREEVPQRPVAAVIFVGLLSVRHNPLWMSP